MAVKTQRELAGQLSKNVGLLFARCQQQMLPYFCDNVFLASVTNVADNGCQVLTDGFMAAVC